MRGKTSKLSAQSKASVARFLVVLIFVSGWVALVDGVTGIRIDPVRLWLLAAGMAAAYGVRFREELNGPHFGRYDEAAGLIVVAGITRLFGAS